MKLYTHPISGNAWKTQLMLSLLEIPHHLVTVNLMAGEHKQPDYLSKNPLGQIPTLQDGETLLGDSQAILVYLATRYGQQWTSEDPLELARLVRWLSLSAGEVRQGPEHARLAKLFPGSDISLARAQRLAGQILSQLEQHLADGRSWLELDRPTIADVAVFPYVFLAPDGGIDLEPYGRLRAWLDRFQELPGYVPLGSGQQVMA